MRAPTTLLFSLIIGTVILSYTASQLQELMTGDILSAEHEPVEDQPGLTERIAETPAGWRDAAGELYESVRERVGASGGDDGPVKITEETVQEVWTWTDETGNQHFSREEPQQPRARSILWPPGEPLPHETPASAASGERETATGGEPAGEQTTDGPEIRDPSEMDIREGLRKFREFQQERHSDPDSP